MHDVNATYWHIVFFIEWTSDGNFGTIIIKYDAEIKVDKMNSSISWQPTNSFGQKKRFENLRTSEMEPIKDAKYWMFHNSTDILSFAHAPKIFRIPVARGAILN